LIAASIMSKKIAEGSDGIVLDVKTGNGAFMKNIGDARKLGRTMIAIGKAGGLKMKALITDMSQPLGFAIGNALEVKQAVEVMRGQGPKDFSSLCVELSARMLVLGKAEKSLDSARITLRRHISDGSALKKFTEIIEYQGGNSRVVGEPDKYLRAASKTVCIRAGSSGYVSAFDTKAIGLAAVNIGAGRKTKLDRIDHSAGFVLYKKIGDKVEKGEALADMFHNSNFASSSVKIFKKAVSVTPLKPRIPRLIYEEL
jgi:pyrimidine-nucleoside phosphorylase